MSDKLLCCPFCGAGEDRIIVQEIEPHTHHFATFMPDHSGSATIECGSCIVGMIADTKEQVTAAWNRRAALFLPDAQDRPPMDVDDNLIESIAARWSDVNDPVEFVRNGWGCAGHEDVKAALNELREIMRNNFQSAAPSAPPGAQPVQDKPDQNAGRPIAWLHNDPDRIDVCHDEAKKVWMTVRPTHVEHYTIPLFRNDDIAAAVKLLDEILSIGFEDAADTSDAFAREYWSALAQKKADIDSTRGAQQAVGYYVSTIIGAMQSRTRPQQMAAKSDEEIVDTFDAYRAAEQEAGKSWTYIGYARALGIPVREA